MMERVVVLVGLADLLLLLLDYKIVAVIRAGRQVRATCVCVCV